MGLGGISIWQLAIILVIVILIFGTKRLKTLGGDLGGALKSFRKAMDGSDEEDETKSGSTEEPKRIQGSEDESPDAEFAEQKEDQHRS